MRHVAPTQPAAWLPNSEPADSSAFAGHAHLSVPAGKHLVARGRGGRLMHALAAAGSCVRP
jgi:hypothetical protein